MVLSETNAPCAKPDAGEVVRAKLKELSETQRRETKADVLLPFRAEIQKCLDGKVALRKIYDALVNQDTHIQMSFSSFDRFVREHCRKRTGKSAVQAPGTVPAVPEEKLGTKLRVQRVQGGGVGPNVAKDHI